MTPRRCSCGHTESMHRLDLKKSAPCSVYVWAEATPATAGLCSCKLFTPQPTSPRESE